MLNSIKIHARAKINLLLDVKRKRQDGYHELSGIMQSIVLYDQIIIKKVYKENYLKLVTDFSRLPTDEKNIVYRTIKKVIELDKGHKINSGLFVQINKNIPVSAGMGGGSSDSAAAIKAMITLFQLDFSSHEIQELAKSLGADVPFFFIEGTAKAEGIGEILTRQTNLPNCYFVIVRPPISISTASVFKKFDSISATIKPDLEKMIYYLDRSNLTGICSCFANSLEEVTATEYPIISDLKQALVKYGAIGSLMSGSGPTVFGCFTDKTTAVYALKSIKNDFPQIKELFVTKNYKYGVK